MGGWWVADGYLPEGSQHIEGMAFPLPCAFLFPYFAWFWLANNPWLKNPVVGTRGTFNTPKYPDHVIYICVCGMLYIYVGKL